MGCRNVILAALCAAAVLSTAGCGRRNADEESPVIRRGTDESSEGEIIEADELPDGSSHYEMPDMDVGGDMSEPAAADGDSGDEIVPPEAIEAPEEEEKPSGQAVEPRKALREMGIGYHKWAFIEAAENGNVDAVRLFLAEGMDVDIINARKYQETALMRAAKAGRQDVVRVLLDAGADVNLRDATGTTALGYALMFKRNETSELLRKAGGKR